MTRSLARRAALGLIAGAVPALTRAQAVPAPVRIGLVTGDNGPSDRLAVEAAVTDAGGAVLGRPVEILQHDAPQDVALFVSGAGNVPSLAMQAMAQEKKRILVVSGPTSTAFTGPRCSPYGFQFGGNTAALARCLGGALTEAGGDRWFFITTADDDGASQQAALEPCIAAAGGTIRGSVRIPFGAADFSVPLAQARASGAKIVGLAMPGPDLRRCLGTAAELGIVNGGQRLASMSARIGDVLAVGQDVCQGMVLANSFYWDFYLPMRSWTDLHIEKIGIPPDEYSTGLFAAVRHWLSAAKAAGTLEADAVATQMRMTPVLYSRDEVVMIQPNGCVPHAMHLWQVKPPADRRYRWDVFERLATLPSPDAYPAPDATGCPLVKA